jgi:hypothetical protein
MRRHLCTHTLPILSVLLTLALASQSSSAESAQVLDRNHSEWVAHSATPGARVRVVITKARPKTQLARAQRPIVLLSATDDDTDYYDELPDLQVGYRRPELVNQSADVQDDISDEIKIRLVLARKRAMQAYTTKWG